MMTLSEWIKVYPFIMHAITAGESWEYQPEYESGNDTFVYEKNTWRKVSYWWGLEVVDTGEVLAHLWEESHGDWECEESYNLRDPNKENQAVARYHQLNEEREESLLHYYQWVSRAGSDPCEEFLRPQRWEKESQMWGITFTLGCDGTVNCSWKQLSGKHVFEADTTPPDAIAQYGWMEFSATRNRFISRHPWSELQEIASTGPHHTSQLWDTIDVISCIDSDNCLTVVDEFRMSWQNPNYKAELKKEALRAVKQICDRQSQKTGGKHAQK